DDEELREHFEMVRRMRAVAQRALRAQGFNVGLNLGAVAGAGVVDHIHTHIVPRWQGDTNFMPVIGATKVLPQALQDTYRVLKQSLEKG
ncbi:MAG: HIT domain-containing protein, partial [Chloroflexota bacterium]